MIQGAQGVHTSGGGPRCIAWLIGPKGRCRKIRYRGVQAGDQWLHLRVAGLNLRRLLNLGLQRTTGGDWMIPTPA